MDYDENPRYRALLDENLESLEQLKEAIAEAGPEIHMDVLATFRDRETALNARQFLKSLADIPVDASVVISAHENEAPAYRCRINLMREISAERITMCEYLMEQAATRFQGNDVHWLIY